MKIIFADSTTTDTDLARIKEIGFDTILLTLDSPDVATVTRFISAGFSLIVKLDWKAPEVDNFVKSIDDFPAVIAYYCFDEPDSPKWPVSIADQEKFIYKMRLLTKKPLAVSLVEEITTRKCSLNFDWYMPDMYYSTSLTPYAWLNKVINYANLAFTPSRIKSLYKGRKFIPIAGLFHNPEYGQCPEQFDFAQRFILKFGHTDYCIFIWNTCCDITGMQDVPQYQQWAKQINEAWK